MTAGFHMIAALVETELKAISANIVATLATISIIA